MVLTNLPTLIYGDEALKIVLSALMGSCVGLEREVRRKAAGFRTLALISLGSTMFTICSYKLGFAGNHDRIAANIITGVGFLGAGVIFRNGFSVSGITTAATIWVSAAIGMLIGINEYMLAVISLVTSLTILYAFQFLQSWIDARFQHRTYIIACKTDLDTTELKEKLIDLKLKLFDFKETRRDGQLQFEFSLSGRETRMIVFNQWLMNEVRVHSFTW